MRFLRLRASGRGGVPVREKDFAEALDFNLVELDVDGMEWVPNGVLDIYILPSSPYSFVPICAVSPCLVHGHMPGFDSPCGLPATEDSGLQAFSYCVPSGKKHPSARQSPSSCAVTFSLAVRLAEESLELEDSPILEGAWSFGPRAAVSVGSASADR